MIKNEHFKAYLVTGDKHGKVTPWLDTGCLSEYNPEKTAVIVLGDFGVNFWLNKTDRNIKRNIEQHGYTFYVVKGNHEARPETLPNIELVYDENVENYVWIEPQFPHIRYFKQYGIYIVAGFKCLVVGGAYSVDKMYRLERMGYTEETNIPTKTGWFADEQLTEEEMISIEAIINDNNFDFILSHTCPYSLMPTDMFLRGIDQSKVDKRMEIFLDKIYQKNRDKLIWLWAHYHRDSIEAPHCEMFYNDVEDIVTIANRWKVYDQTGQLDWWLTLSPYFYQR